MRRFKSWSGRRQTLATTTHPVASSRQCIIQVFASHQFSALLAASSWRWMALLAGTMATASFVTLTTIRPTRKEHDDCNYKPRSYPRITQSRIPMKGLLSRRHCASCDASHVAYHTDDLVVDSRGCSSALFAPAQWYRAAQLARLSYANSVLDIRKGLQYIPMLRSSNGHASISATLPLEPPRPPPRGVVLDATPGTRPAAPTTKSTSTQSLNSKSTLSRDFAAKESRYQLVYATTQSAPGQPAHFLAVAEADPAVALDACDCSGNDKLGDSDSSNNDNALNAIATECSSHNDVLSVVLVIRGTQSISTDLMPSILPDLMNAVSVVVDPLGTTTTAIESNAVSVVPYSIPNRNEKGADTTWTSGRAHSYFLQCGQWIVDLHHDCLLQLCRNVPPHGRVEMTLIGHSLGAAVAVMAGLEWSRRLHEQQQVGAPNVVVKVIGLGCPPLLSPNLAAQCQDWITTLVYKDDIIPRLSVDTLSNLLYKMQATTWDETSLWNQFQGDLLVQSLQQQPTSGAPLANGFLNGNTTAQLLMKAILLSLLDQDQPPCALVELVPPGTCVQIQHESDTKSPNVVSARIVPNSFYSEIRLSPQMMDDHSLQHGYLPALWNLQRQGRGSKDLAGP